MIERAFSMKLKEGFQEEYRKRHDEIWEELKSAFKEAGILDYSIFLDEKNLTLFAVQKLRDHNKANQMANLPIVREWWNYMADTMNVNEDNSPVVTKLNNVFTLES